VPANELRVEVDRGIVVNVASWDDVSLRIEYLGPDFHLHSGRFGFSDSAGPSGRPDGFDFDAEFLAEAESWLAAGCVRACGWVVEVELRLASGLPGSSDAA
jgi:hypothetical protein